MRGFPSDAVLRMLEPSRPKSGGFFAFKNIFVSWLVFLKKLVGWKVKPLYRIQSWEQKNPAYLGGWAGSLRLGLFAFGEYV
jgi:hypothetical protein